MNYNQSNST